MLIICDACNSKIRAPEAAAGKRIKCPKCAKILQVTAAEESTPAEPKKPDVKKTRIGPKEVKSTRLSTKPLPPEPEANPGAESAPETPDPVETLDAEEPTGTAVTAASPRPTPGKKPPPIKASKRGSIDDDEDDDEEETPPTRKRVQDDDEDDDDLPGRKRKKRRRDDDEDDDLSIKKRRRDRAPAGVNGMAMTSMILGICGIVFSLSGCCCCFLHVLPLILGIVAVILGHMSVKTPGSEGVAMTGLITGYISLALTLIAVVLSILGFFFNLGIQGMNMGGGGFNRPPVRRF